MPEVQHAYKLFTAISVIGAVLACIAAIWVIRLRAQTEVIVQKIDVDVNRIKKSTEDALMLTK
jgi:hypothetical protein